MEQPTMGGDSEAAPLGKKSPGLPGKMSPVG